MMKEIRITNTSPFNYSCSEAEASDQNLGYVNPAAPEPSYSPTEVHIKQNVQQEPEGYSRDVRSAFSGLPKVKPQWRDYYMKMLIVGEVGQGPAPANCASYVWLC